MGIHELLGCLDPTMLVYGVVRGQVTHVARQPGGRKTLSEELVEIPVTVCVWDGEGVMRCVCVIGYGRYSMAESLFAWLTLQSEGT